MTSRPILASAVALLAALPGACAEPAPFSLRLPPSLQRALAAVTDLAASAQLVAHGASEPAPGVALTRGDDGVSFSGFVDAAPGDYTLEIAFDGVHGGQRLFLGRLASDSFTVVRGQTATPLFSHPLDPDGRPNDAADGDGDGLANLDEILWGTDLGAADSDGDNLDDGVDCDPANPSSSYPIAAGGSHEDCDGDGVRRIDLPFGSVRGEDCNDKDPAVKPGASDDCGDAVDQDCDPGTCPGEGDSTPPTISDVLPVEGAAVGCHARISAVIRDNASVTTASVTIADCPLTSGGARTLLMTLVSTATDRWESSPFNLATSEGFGTDCHQFVVRAMDGTGNQTESVRHLNFELSIPQIAQFTPSTIGTISSPVSVSVTASASSSIAQVELWRAARTSGYFDVTHATRLGGASAATTTVAVDPSGLADGEYIVYPTVVDQLGNALQPASGYLNGGELSADYYCLGVANMTTIPVRMLLVGNSGSSAAKMRDHLAEAIAAAEAVDSAAQLVSAKAFGVDGQGRVDLSDASSYMKRWEYGFYISASGTWVTVSWFTPAYATTNPVLDADAGNVVETVPFLDPDALIDSDVAASAFAASAGCGALSGDENDYMIYDVVSGQSAVTIGAAGKTWRGTATTPVTTLISCQ